MQSERVEIRNSKINNRFDIHIALAEMPLFEARLATALLEKWGLAASMPDGEDTTGRAKLRLAEADELVKRACDIAQLSIAEFRKREWMLKVPSMEEVRAELAAVDAKD